MSYYNRTRKDLPMIGITKTGLFLFLTGTAKFYKNGDYWTPILRWWHPISILLFLLIIIFICPWSNYSITDAYKELFVYRDYFKDKKDNLEFYKLSYWKYYKKNK